MRGLRYFYITCFVLLAAVTVFSASWFKQLAEDKLIKETGATHNNSVVDIYTKTIWRAYEREAYKCRTNGVRNCTAKATLKKISDSFFKTLPITAWQTLDVTLKPLAASNGDSNTQLSIAKNSPKLGVEKHYISYDGQVSVISALPIKPEKYGGTFDEVTGMVILAYDVSNIWKDPSMIYYAFLLSSLLLLALIFGYLYFNSFRIERMIANQHERNIDLRSAKKMAEEENQSKSQFLANVSHELRTPLNAIIGFSEIINDEVMGPINNKQYKEYIGDIHASGAHLLALINDILDYSKAEAGKLEVDMKETDVTKIMKNAIRLVIPRAEEASVTLIDEIAKEHYVMNTDGKRLKQILLNLLSNSVKFTPEGGSVTLIAWHNIKKQSLVIEVKDTGVGIAPEDISKVMATFGQVENKLSRKYEGTGLGLPLSRKLVELMGGQLNITSEVGIGTNVSITFPLKGENVKIIDPAENAAPNVSMAATLPTQTASYETAAEQTKATHPPPPALPSEEVPLFEEPTDNGNGKKKLSESQKLLL